MEESLDSEDDEYWRHERAGEMISLLSEKGMWDKEPLERVKWKEPPTMANCHLTFTVFKRQWTKTRVLCFTYCWFPQNGSLLAIGGITV